MMKSTALGGMTTFALGRVVVMKNLAMGGGGGAVRFLEEGEEEEEEKEEETNEI